MQASDQKSHPQAYLGMQSNSIHGYRMSTGETIQFVGASERNPARSIAWHHSARNPNRVGVDISLVMGV